MIIKLDTIKQIIKEEISAVLKERKQVGELYHYTFIQYAVDILKSQKLKPSEAGAIHKGRQKDDQFPNYISLTRTSRRKDFTHTEDLNVKFVLDGDAISDKYEIVPYQDSTVFIAEYPAHYGSGELHGFGSEPDVKYDEGGYIINNAGERVLDDEMEERIYSLVGLPDLLKYIKKIVVYKPSDYDRRTQTRMDRYNSYLPQLEQLCSGTYPKITYDPQTKKRKIINVSYNIPLEIAKSDEQDVQNYLSVKNKDEEYYNKLKSKYGK